MDKLEQEIDELMTDYFLDYSRLDLKAIVSYFYQPCTFIVPLGVFVFSSESEIEGFWSPRFDDLTSQGFVRTERDEVNIKVLSDDTAVVSARAVRYQADGSELERRGVTIALRKTDDGWKFVTLIHHSPDKVMRMD